ncbi:MAG: hypothetical protein KGL92_06395 [Gammaproteobacteria bacterium]|nr:hypothetical protein [Gammaproteobacteria bacterium]
MRNGIYIALSTAAFVIGVASRATADDSSFGKDLMATIALQGKTCDKLVSIKRNGDSDYSVACKDGHRYHIYVNAQGRVIVQPQ